MIASEAVGGTVSSRGCIEICGLRLYTCKGCAEVTPRALVEQEIYLREKGQEMGQQELEAAFQEREEAGRE